MSYFSSKRAATSPLNSEFNKRPKLGLSDEELKRLNLDLKQELEDLISSPISSREGVESKHLLKAFREVAIKASNVDKTFTDRRVCMDFIEQLPPDTKKEFATLWIKAHNKGDWSEFANYFLLLVEPPSAVSSMPPELIEDSAPVVPPVQSEKATLESWDVAYVGEAAGLLYDHIVTYSKDTDSYARYTSIVQSSGMGKSRAVDELSKQHLVIPVNIRNEPDGFPPSDVNVRDWLLQSKTKIEASNRSCAFLCATFITLLHYLQNIDAELAAIGVSSVAGVNSLAADFRLLMTKDQTFSHQGPTRRRFYADLLKLASNMQPIHSTSSADGTPSSILKDSTSLQIYDLKQELKNLMMFLIPGFDVMNTYPPALIISFDEAHALANVEVKSGIPPWSRFYEFRRALRVIQSYPCFSLFLATTGKVNQFMPNPGDSNRVQQELMKLIPPFCELGYDQLAEKVVSDTTTVDDVSSVRVMASLSRPLFATRYLKGDEDIRKSIIKFAGEKLLCGAFPSPESVEALTSEQKLACISVRMPLEFNLRSRNTEKTLVEKHLRVCLHVDPGFETAVTIAPSEPLLAEASSLIMNNLAFDLPRCLLKELESRGLDKGNRGELIGMALCLLARDAAAKKLDNRVIPVSTFIQELLVSDDILHSKPVHARTPDEAKKTFEDTFSCSTIFFNHFVKFRDRGVINRRYLWRLIARGAAGLCADFQFGVDIVIPFLFWDRRLCRVNVSALFIQCKNDGSFHITPRLYLFDMMNPYHIQFFDEKETDPVPIIRMVFALASPDAGVVVLQARDRSQPPRDAAFKAKFQADKYTSFDIWCAKASKMTFCPVQEDEIFQKLLLRFRIFPDVYDEKRTEGLQNVTRSMNPGTALHAAHYCNYAPDP